MKNNELFVVRPNLKQHYGRTITKETKFDEQTDNEINSNFGRVHQVLDNLVLTTEIERESEYNGVKSTEKSIMTQELPEGTVLIWNEAEGYIIPNVAVYKMADLEKEIGDIKKIYKDNTDMNPEE